nr:diguanylate cyclase [Halomonas kenyensis]
MLALAMIGRWVIMPALVEEERQLAVSELDRIERSLAQGQQSLLAHTRDWAHWDDSFGFVHDRHEAYSAANFSRDMFTEMNYQAMLFFRADGSLHWAAGIDPDSGRYTSCPGTADDCRWTLRVVTALQSALEQVPEEGMSLVITSPWPALVGVNRILPTSRTGPSAGWLAKVRLLDAQMEATLSEQTGLTILLDTLSMVSTEENTASLPPGSSRLEYTSDGEIAASRFLPSHQSDNMLWLSTRIPRDSFRARLQTFHYGLIWTGGLLLLVIIIVMFLLERMVLAPLRRFSRFTQLLHQSHSDRDIPAALQQRSDEIGTLSRDFQALLTYQRGQAAKLLELSRQDPLTGLANRRLYDERFSEAMCAEPSDNPKLSVLMLDIDHFKLYNDHYGHPTGDVCLMRLAACMEACLGGRGYLVARTGGEEFSALLPGTTLEDAVELGETLRAAILELALPHAASPTAQVVTASIGAATYGDSLSTPSDIMSAADQALYQAKASGRNRVVAHCPQALTRPVT